MHTHLKVASVNASIQTDENKDDEDKDKENYATKKENCYITAHKHVENTHTRCVLNASLGQVMLLMNMFSN